MKTFLHSISYSVITLSILTAITCSEKKCDFSCSVFKMNSGDTNIDPGAHSMRSEYYKFYLEAMPKAYYKCDSVCVTETGYIFLSIESSKSGKIQGHFLDFSMKSLVYVDKKCYFR